MDIEIQIKRRLNMLIVDDDDMCVLMHRRIAEESGLFGRIRSVKDGFGALEILKEGSKKTRELPDIILLDLTMPFMNGVEFLDGYRQLNFRNKERITIAMLTSSVNANDRELASSLGVSHFLTKPFNAKDLLMVALSVYNRRQMWQLGTGFEDVGRQ